MLIKLALVLNLESLAETSQLALKILILHNIIVAEIQEEDIPSAPIDLEEAIVVDQDLITENIGEIVTIIHAVAF